MVNPVAGDTKVTLIITNGSLIVDKGGIFANVGMNDVEKHEALKEAVVDLAKLFMKKMKEAE